MNAFIDISSVVLKTKRLELRAFKETDLDDFFEYAKVDGVGQMAGWTPHENKEKTKQILDMFIEEKKTFAIVYDGKVIGSLGIENYNESESPEYDSYKCREIGYVLSKDYWGQGMMPEAVKEVLRYLFEDVKLDYCFCGYFDYNNQSRRVQEKVGFKKLKEMEYHTRMNTVEHCILSIMSKEDYFNK